MKSGCLLVVLSLSACADTIPSDEPMGSPCAGPPGGEATLDGTALPDDSGPMTVEARHLELDSASPTIWLSPEFDNGPTPGCHGGSIGAAFPSLQMYFEGEDVTLGEHSIVDPATDDTGMLALMSELDNPWARQGVVAIDGWDPDSQSLCGRFDLSFTDGSTASGSFAAVPITYGPASTSLCGPDDDESLYACSAAGGDPGPFALLALALGLLWIRSRPRRASRQARPAAIAT